jgi:hypothetical protein
MVWSITTWTAASTLVALHSKSSCYYKEYFVISYFLNQTLCKKNYELV